MDNVVAGGRGRVGLYLFDVGLILAVCFLLFFWGIRAIPFYDKHEAREALVVWEMTHSGNWILPLVNGTDIPYKPPLFHWLGALVSKSVDQVDELTVRFPSALLGTLGVLLVYLTGVCLWSRGAGLVSALVLSTSFQWWKTGVETRVDMTLSFCMLCCFLFFYYFYRTGGGKNKAWVFGILLGLATLTKGPLGFLIPVFTALIFLWLRGDFRFLKKAHPLLIIIVCAIVAGSWYGLAFWQGGKAFLLEVFRENVQTTVGEEAGHPHPLYYYIPALFQNMAPWSPFLLSVGAFVYHYRKRSIEEGVLYLLVWFAAVFIFFSVFKEKRPVYILPLCPAVALLMGAWWRNLKDEPSPSSLFLARLAGYLNAALFVIASGMLLFGVMGPGLQQYVKPLLRPKDQDMLLLVGRLLDEHRAAVLFWSAALGLAGIVLALSVKRNGWGAAIGSVTAAAAVSFFLLNHFEPYLARQYSFKAFMGRVLPEIKDEPLFFYGSPDYGVVFYARRHVPTFQGALEQDKAPFYLLVWERDWKNIADKPGVILQEASESLDRAGSQGRLFLVAVGKKN